MLDAVAELPEHVIGDIRRILRDKPDANAFGADQTDDLFNLIQQDLRGVVEQQVRFVKEEHQLRFFQSPASGSCS